MGQFNSLFESKKCCFCKNNKANYEYIEIYNNIKCNCNTIDLLKFYNFIPKKIFNNLLDNLNKCNCSRNNLYNEYYRLVLSNNRDICEFLEFPKNRNKNEIKFCFYACNDCILYRPWAINKFKKLI